MADKQLISLLENIKLNGAVQVLTTLVIKSYKQIQIEVFKKGGLDFNFKINGFNNPWKVQNFLFVKFMNGFEMIRHKMLF